MVAKRFTYGWGRGVKHPIDGRWAATTVCERPWNTAVPDNGHAPWTMDRPCRSCISRLASHHVTGDVASFL